ncbi:DeoR family transcriptional regulator [Brevibacillus reuszeri]|uniref:Phosphoesterase n=1 Tax=Brevibacillus reuszeri TaxID=54915 RepID=A0A0K9YQE9_9BACL|nr:metallophosphoesterase family protein [Brevibacillus reuszeri]KNB70862.1 phosphoesterase [Brevibacillus reuszeri]MED1857257.1 metallophosphoesterase family protein [Brevibacillus reuszeri]GED66915.1 DeoR family transcriptional regulator [Brevibacillus reuszeri]
MRVAALYDIHGNLPALNALLAELENEKPDLIVIGGDIVSGPMPTETLERLMQLDTPVRFIRGNGDREVVSAFDGAPLPPEMSEAGRETTLWVSKQLNCSQRDFLSQLPLTLPLEIEGLGEVLFCHASPVSDEDIFTPLTPEERLFPMFQGIAQRIVICGHTHIQFKRKISDILILNTGSVGMPYAEKPGAYWLLLGPNGYEHRWTPYDVEAAAKEIMSSTEPHAQSFAEQNVRHIPTAQEAMEVLERMARKSTL